jgi:hypothetical protein
MLLFAEDSAVNPTNIIAGIVTVLGTVGFGAKALGWYEKWQQGQALRRTNAKQDRGDRILEYEKLLALDDARITKLEVKVDECEKEKGALEIRCTRLETQHEYMVAYLVHEGMDPPAWFGSGLHTPLQSPTGGSL